MLFEVKEGKTLTKRIDGVSRKFSGGMLIDLTADEAKANAEHILPVEEKQIETVIEEKQETNFKKEFKTKKRNKK